MKKIVQARKRDGRVVPFNKEKITNAIFRAAEAVGGEDKELADKLASKVVEILEEKMPLGAIPNIEDIQDIVEKVLIEGGHAKTAKAYILYRNERTRIREQQKKILNGKTTKLPFSMNALQVVAKRYLVRNREGEIIESPEDMFYRVATTLANVEKSYGKNDEEIAHFRQQFYDILSNFEYTPAGRTITNAGSPTPIVPNCVVLHVEDSMDNIFGTLKDAALLQQSGCGLGFPFHLLRPGGSIAKRSRGVASGPVSFLHVYNDAFGVIKQQNRHGANMAVLRVDHPDILEFVHAKDVEGTLKNFNISVGLTDKFMEQVKNNDTSPWTCEWKGKSVKPRRIYRQGRTVVDIKEETMTAREIFMEIIDSAWKTGEPGCVFLDQVNRTNPLPGLGRIEACNPCITGDSMVSTEHGFMEMERLVEKHGHGDVSVLCDNRLPVELHQADGKKLLIYKDTKGTHMSRISAAWKTGNKPVWKVETKSGYELEATSDHKIMTTSGWVEAKDLTPDNEILIQSGEGRFSVDHKLPFEVRNEFFGKNYRKYRYSFPHEWSRELGQFLGWVVGDGWIRDKEKEWMVGLTFGKEDKQIMEHLKKIGNKIYGPAKKEIERERNTYHLNYGSKYFIEYMKKFGVKISRSGEKEVPKTIFTAPKEAVSGFLQGLFSSDGTVMLDEKKGNYYVRLTTKSMKLAKQVQLLLLNFGIKSKIYDRSRAPQKRFSYETKKGEKRIYTVDGILFEVHIRGKNIERFSRQIGFLCDKHKDKMEKILQKNLREEAFTDGVKSVEYAGMRDVYDLTEPATHSFIANGFVISNCAEQFLHDGDVCNLGSINLDKFVKNKKIDFDRLRHVTRLAIRLQDNVVDLTDAPVEKINESIRSNRRVGLGIMGFADMLYKLRIPYNSEEGIMTAEKVMKCIQDAAHGMSQELAEEKGIFPNWEKSIYKEKGIKMRNAALTNIAPTGTIAMIFDVSGGVEPYFALAYHYRGVLGGNTELYYVNKHLKAVLKEIGMDDEKTMKKIYEEGSIQNIEGIPEWIKKVFVTAMDISPEDHTRMQAAFQKHCDNAISKTINFPSDATREDVLQGYILAWELGCKGCTVYRDNSRQLQVLNLNKQKDDEEPEKTQIEVAATVTGESVSTNPGEQEMEQPVMQNIGRSAETNIGKNTEMNDETNNSLNSCPECSTELVYTEGCYTCKDCGWGKCSI